MAQETIRPPVIDSLDKVRFILFYAFSTCEAPFQLYVEFAAKPTYDFLLAIGSFDLKDFVQEMFRPRGVAGHKQSRHGRHKKPPPLGVPDVSEELGSRVALRNIGDFNAYGKGTRMFFHILGEVDRVAWNLFLFEGVTDIGFEAVHGVLQSDNRFCPQLGRFLGENPFQLFGGAGPLWKAIGYSEKKYAVGCTSSNGFSVYLPEGRWVLNVAGECTAVSGDTLAAVRILNQSDADNVVDVTGPFFLAEDEPQKILVSGNVFGPAIIRWEAASETSFVEFRDVHYSALKVGNY